MSWLAKTARKAISQTCEERDCAGYFYQFWASFSNKSQQEQQQQAAARSDLLHPPPPPQPETTAGVWDALQENDKLGKNKHEGRGPTAGYMMTGNMWFRLVIVLHFPAVVRDFHQQPNQPCCKHSPHLFSPQSNYTMWLKNILNRAFADFYLCKADLFHVEQ